MARAAVVTARGRPIARRGHARAQERENADFAIVMAVEQSSGERARAHVRGNANHPERLNSRAGYKSRTDSRAMGREISREAAFPEMVGKEIIITQNAK
jgi:hypothetical protein